MLTVKLHNIIVKNYFLKLYCYILWTLLKIPLQTSREPISFDFVFTNSVKMNRVCASICKQAVSAPGMACVAPKILQTGIEIAPTAMCRRRLAHLVNFSLYDISFYSCSVSFMFKYLCFEFFFIFYISYFKILFI